MKIAIIGAGFGGMAAAYDLRKAGHEVTIFESADFVGGLASGFKEPHWEWSVEKFYHHWFASDRHMLALIKELGWEDKVLFPRPFTVVYQNGKFQPFDSYLTALKFSLGNFSLINVIRFGLVGVFLRLTNNWRALEQVTVDAWMRKWAGEKVYQTMWEPLVIGKFGERYAKQVNMAWLWARLHARTTRLGTFAGGFQNFANLFADKLRGMDVTIKLETPITHIKRADPAGLSIETPEGSSRFDKCLVTVAPSAFARMCPSLPKEYLEGLLRLKSMGAVVMTLALKHKLSEQGYYWYNIPKSAGFPFLALVEHTNFMPREKFGGEHIVYLGDYLEPEHEYFRLTQDELLDRFAPTLVKFNPRFERNWIRKVWLARTAYAQPVPLINHSKNIPPIETPVEGLYFASMSQVYPWDRGTNFAVEIGRRAARAMRSET
jgi:protoporphyrinogen oxidase